MRSVAMILAVAWCSTALAGEVAVKLPASVTAVSARALGPSKQEGQDGPATPGKVGADGTVAFDLDKDVTYDLEITLKDGRILRGVNLNWYDQEPANPNAGEITDDDKEQIRQLVSNVQSFYDISRIVTLHGDHQRAAVLVERTRTANFHSDKGGEVVYRMEIWYFKNEFGGWQEIPQTNKVLIRRRFASLAEYKAAEEPMRWMAELGGIQGTDQTINVTSLAAEPGK